MPGSQDFSAQQTDEFVAQMIGLSRNLQRIGSKPVSSPAEAEKLRAEAKRLIQQNRTVLEKWAKEDLRDLYTEAYRSGTADSLPKAARDESLRHRNRLLKNGTSALADMDQWVDKRIDRNQETSTVKKLQKIIKATQAEIEGGGVSPSRKAMLKQQLDQAKEFEQKSSKRLDKLRKETAVGDTPEVLYRRRRRGAGDVRGTVFSRRPAEEHFKMLADTGYRDITNAGYVRGWSDRGKEWFLVSDGPDCGWTSHADSEKANGKVVQRNNIVPYAHPHCKRAFIMLPDGPNGKSTKKMVRDVLGLDTRNLAKVAKGGAIAGQALTAGLAIYQSPLTRQIVRAILADAEIALSDNSKKILGDWVNFYEKTEAQVLETKGQVVNVLSRADLRNKVTSSIEGALAQDAVVNGSALTPIRIDRDAARVLRLSQNTTKGELISKFEDYADFTRHQSDSVGGLRGLRSVGAAAQDEEVLRELYDEAAAIKFGSIQLGRGSQLLSNMERIGKIIDESMKAHPERMQIEAVRLAATAYDPLPWARLAVGDFRFTVGMPSRARADLAEELYIRMRGQSFRSTLDLQYARRAGVELSQRTINATDLYHILQPRLTYFGSPLHASIALENGRLIPALRLYPENVLLRQLSLKARLRAGSLEDFLSRAREVDPERLLGWLAEEIPKLSDDLIWTIDLFRNSPVSASARIYGDKIESFAVKLRPDNEALNYTARWTPNFKPNYKIMTKARLDQHLKFNGLTPLPDEPRAVKIARLEKLPSYTRREGSLVMLPRRFGGAVITSSSKDTMSLIVGLAHVKGSLMEAARVLGIEYASMMIELRAWLSLQGRRIEHVLDGIQEFQKRITQSELLQVRSADDLRNIGVRYSSSNTDAPALRMQAVTDEEMEALWQKYKDDPFYGEELVDSFRSQVGSAMDRDTAAALRFWDEHSSFFGNSGKRANAPLMEVESGQSIMRYQFKFETIQVDPSISKRPIKFGIDRKVLGMTNGSSSHSGFATLIHEMGHHWSVTTFGPDNVAKFFDEVVGKSGIPWKVPPPDLRGLGSIEQHVEIDLWMNGDTGVAKQVRQHLSVYAASNGFEFMAEIFAEAFAVRHPKMLGMKARQYLIGQ